MPRTELAEALDAAITACQAVHAAPRGSAEARAAVAAWEATTQTLAAAANVTPTTAEVASISGADQGIEAARDELGLDCDH